MAEELERMHLITNKSLFVLWAKLAGQSKQIKTGEYALSASMPPISKSLRRYIKGWSFFFMRSRFLRASPWSK